MITGQNYIGFERSSEGNIRFKTFNPEKNSETEWEFFEATENEVARACELAEQAFNSYRKISNHRRAEFLRAIAAEIEALGDELIDTYCSESGLSRERAMIERSRTLQQLLMFAEHICKDNWRGNKFESADPDRQPLPKPSLARRFIPLGPVAVFGSSNFPLAYSTAGGDTASALASGCPVVVKSHPMHAGTGELVAGAIIQAAINTDMPEGVFSNLNTKGVEIGTSLARHPSIKAIGFTGSIGGGRALMNIAAARSEPIPIFAEMGSMNPVIISENSLKNKMDYWVDKYADSITNGTGQFCTNPGLIIGIQSEYLEEFSTKLAGALENIETSCMLNPKIHSAYKSLSKDAVNSIGVKSLTNKHESKTNYASNTLLWTTGEEFIKNQTLNHEIFGPLSIIISCKDRSKIIGVITSLHGQLTGTLIVEKEELENWEDVISALELKVGRIILNGVPTGVEVSEAMQHGGPYPASSDSRFTAVGVNAINRWIRPITYQGFPSKKP